MHELEKTEEAALGGAASTGGGRLTPSNSHAQYIRNPPSRKDPKTWRPCPGPGQGWRKPSQWLVRKRLEKLKGALPPSGKRPPRQKQTLTLQLTIEVSPLAAWVLRRALLKRGFRRQLRLALGMAIEDRLQAWGFPVDGVYKVIAGVLSECSKRPQDNLHEEGE